jgi:uncharacterized phage-associated protein
MGYDARQIVNWFIKRAAKDSRVLSIMSLLKLAYIAHGWNLEIRNQPLLSNKIEAWQYGPVIPDVYNTFRKQGVGVKNVDPEYDEPLPPSIEGFLEEIYNIYGKLSPFRLSELTHVAGGPWETARNWGGWYAEIPDDLIKAHYVSKRQTAG